MPGYGSKNSSFIAWHLVFVIVFSLSPEISQWQTERGRYSYFLLLLLLFFPLSVQFGLIIFSSNTVDRNNMLRCCYFWRLKWLQRHLFLSFFLFWTGKCYYEKYGTKKCKRNHFIEEKCLHLSYISTLNFKQWFENELSITRHCSEAARKVSERGDERRWKEAAILWTEFFFFFQIKTMKVCQSQHTKRLSSALLLFRM